MKIRFLSLSLFCLLSNTMHARVIFQDMSSSINKHFIPFASNPDDNALILKIKSSLFSNLQNLHNKHTVKSIINSIDIVLSTLKKDKKNNGDSEMIFAISIVAHVLCAIAKKEYVSIFTVRELLHYWKAIDQTSLISYCFSHYPTAWSTKLNGGFDIKQKILKTELLYGEYIKHLGSVVKIIHQLPQTKDPHALLTWMNRALICINQSCFYDAIYTVNSIESLNIVELLTHIKSVLKDYVITYDQKFFTDKKEITPPSYFIRSFGKITATISLIASTAALVYYKGKDIYDKISNANNSLIDFTKNWIFKPINNTIDAIFSGNDPFELDEKEKEYFENELEKRIVTEINKLAEIDKLAKKQQTADEQQTAYEQNRQKIIKFVSQDLTNEIKNTRKNAYKEKIIKLKSFKEILTQKELQTSPSDEDETKQCEDEVIKILGDLITPEHAKTIVENNNHQEFKKLLKQKAGIALYNPKGWIISDSTDKLIQGASIRLDLILREYPHLLLHFLNEGIDLAIEGYKKLEKTDHLFEEMAAVKRIVTLTPAILTISGSYMGLKGIYNFITNKDFSFLTLSLKELETATIVSMNEKIDDKNYGLFIFLLETLKIGVEEIIPSRYTKKGQLLEDLARLESPELTFEQRHKLVSQIRRSYSIFK